VSLRGIRVVTALAAIASLVAYLLLAIRPVVPGVVGGLSVALILLRASRMEGRRRLAWILIGIAVLLVAVGDMMLAARSNIVGSGEFPRAPDVLFLLAYLPLAGGLMWLGRA
jgi:hypothetical protein